LRFASERAADLVLELRLPVPADRAFDVTLVIRRGIDIDFNETKAGVFPWAATQSVSTNTSGCEYCSDMTRPP